MLAPERRTRWDLAAAAALVVIVLVGFAALWWTSEARRTTLTPAPDSGAPAPAPLQQVPAALVEAWRAASPATPAPVAQGSMVVTAAGGEVAGRDLHTGAVRWSYRRDLALCTVAAALHEVVAVYRRGGTCSEVTALNGADGRRVAQRTGPVPAPTRLAAADGQVATTGPHYLEVWRYDLVRTLAYGRLPTPAQPGTQPRPDCLQGSVALGPGRLAVVEHCPGERVRLTVQHSAPKQADQPEVIFSTLLRGTQARVVAITQTRVAVAQPDPARLVVLDEQGNAVAEHPLNVADADLRGDPPAGLVELSTTPTGLYWFTGSATVALDTTELRPRWTHPGSLGPGSAVAGRLLVPVPGALAVLDPPSGAQLGTLAVDRGGYRGPVLTANAGDVILEQRGDTLVALRARPR
jgi:hypothetical protein